MTKPRGRPKGPRKTQIGIRLPEHLYKLLDKEGYRGVLSAFMSKAWPAGWSFIDEPENIKKKDRLDYSQKSKRAAQGWTNSNMIMYLLDDMMRHACREMPELVLGYHRDISLTYVELAQKHQKYKIIEKNVRKETGL